MCDVVAMKTTSFLMTGNAETRLRDLSERSVHLCVCSPPYFGLRNYSEIEQIGHEDIPKAYVERLVNVFREVRRVLRDDGSLYVVIGDCYANDTKWGGASGGKHAADLHGNTGIGRNKQHTGLKSKDLIGIPWMIAFALRDDGWYLREEIIWKKDSCMPESVQDRCTRQHETVFHLTKSQRYYHDWFAIAESAAGMNEHDLTGQSYDAPGQATQTGSRRPHGSGNGYKRESRLTYADENGARGNDTPYEPCAIRNARSVWTINPEPFDSQMCIACGTYFRGTDYKRLPKREDEHRKVWRACSICRSEIDWLSHFACVDDKTEALTPEGWRKHTDLKNGSIIAAYDKENDTLRWETATFHRYDYDGNLIAIEKRDTSQRLTPNHRCLVRKRWKNKLHVVEAQHLNSTMDLPMAAKFECVENAGVGEHLAAILGWYITEGTVIRKGAIKIYQSESANPEKVDIIRHHLCAMKADFREWHRHRIIRGKSNHEVIFSIRGELARTLTTMSPHKNIDMAWLKWPKKELEVFFESAMAGDGHKRPDGRQSFAQKDTARAEAMQIIAIMLGKRAHLGTRKCGKHDVHITEGKWLTLRETNGANYVPKHEKYTGTVWCPSVPSSFWLARRNGKPFITGNTYPSRLVSRILRCSTPDGGCCARCETPLERIVEKGEPDAAWQKASGADTSGGYAGASRDGATEGGAQDASATKARILAGMTSKRTAGWRRTCICPADTPTTPAVVLDPFSGAGTTLLSAARLGRQGIGIDLKKEYHEMSMHRLRDPNAKCLDGDGGRLAFVEPNAVIG